MPDISIKGLTFKFPKCQKYALDHIDLEISSGSFVLICGKSGSGKTTLLRQLKSAIRPEGERGGSIFYAGISLDDISLYDQASKIGYVSQEPFVQITEDKVWQEIASGLESVGCDSSVIRSRIAEISCFYNIEPLCNSDTRNLSGGQKNLIALASAGVLNPELLIMDCPLSELDPVAAADFLGLLQKINTELGVTIIITEQRLEEVCKLASKIVVLEDGKIVHEGSPREIAKEIYNDNSELKYGLPSTIRLFHGLRPGKDLSEAPLTIGEARAWLKDAIGDRELLIRSLPDKRIANLKGSPVLELKNITFKYKGSDQYALKGLSLSVMRGNIHAIVGDIGSGKSTLLRIAYGGLAPSAGTVKLDNKSISKIYSKDLYQTGIGMLPQCLDSFFTKDTVREELEDMLSFRHLPAAELDIAVKKTALSVGAIEYLDRNPRTLSFGEKQVVAIAKMIMLDLKVLLLDEPTKGLGALSKRKLAYALHELVQNGMTIVMASHDMEFCAKYATTVSMIYDGSIATTDTPQSFFSSNSFYTTAPSRMSREFFWNVVTDEEFFILCQENEV